MRICKSYKFILLVIMPLLIWQKTKYFYKFGHAKIKNCFLGFLWLYWAIVKKNTAD